MSAQIALSLVWILVDPQERKEKVKGQSPKGLLTVCSTFASELHLCFGLDAANDEAQIASVAAMRCSAS